MMDPSVRRYLAEIGRRGGYAVTASKAHAARLNGARGGRPRKEATVFRETSAYGAMKEVMSGESWKIAFFNFVDGFRRDPRMALLRKDPQVLHPQAQTYALLQSICIQLSLENGLELQGWLRKEALLPEPWFVSGVKSLYAMALRETPLAFRKNNIFVMDNFLSRA